MKVKRLPEDFVVEEQSDVAYGPQGKYALYRLTKRGIGTLEAMNAIQQRWKLTRYRLSWGGLKDKHAVTTQYFTVAGGPQRGLQQSSFQVECLGYTSFPFRPQDITGNRFELVLRNLTMEQVGLAQEAEPVLKSVGVPNYFDDQRFGSVSLQGEFIADPWIRGDYERSLWLTFAEPNAFDSSSEKHEKAILREYWGDWKTCKERLSKSHRRSIITFLNDRPGDFKGAWGTVNKDLRSLYLAAYQSQLWNELLSEVLQNIIQSSELLMLPLKTGRVAFPTRMSDQEAEQVSALKLPLPSARISMDEITDSMIQECLTKVLAKRNLELRQIRTKHPRDSFFSKGYRPAMGPLHGFAMERIDDELHPGRNALRVSFELPRGSYATMVIKRLGMQDPHTEELASTDDAD